MCMHSNTIEILKLPALYGPDRAPKLGPFLIGPPPPPTPPNPW